MKFDSINHLRKKYRTMGSFYKVDGLWFRNYADVIKIDYDSSCIDCYIVMMNPGSCKPKDKNKPLGATSPETAILTEVKCDRAQKRVMQLMDNTEYKKYRILNLIDYKEPDSNKAISFTKEHHNYLISIFSPEREEELNAVTKYNSPFILAYGVGDKLNSYKKLVNEFVKDKKIYGIKKEDTDLGYYYLSPPKENDARKVLTQIVNQVTDLK